MRNGVDVRIKVIFSVVLLSLTLAGAAFADPPKKKPTYPAPEQSNTIGSLGKPRDPSAPPLPRESSAPVAAPEIPKVEAEPPAPLAAPDRFQVHSEGGQMPGGTIGASPMMARVPMGPPPTGFLPDHPFVSGIIAGLVGADLGAKLYGGPMMGDQNGVIVGYAVRVGVILVLAWLIFRLIARRASGAGEEMPTVSSQGRREPSFNRGDDADVGRGRREPKFDRNSR